MNIKQDSDEGMLDSMKKMQDSMNLMIDSMKMKDNQVQFMLDSLKVKQDSMETRLAEQEKEKPYLSMCAYKELHKVDWRKGYDPEKGEVIPLDSVFHLATNIVEGGLDTCSGEFLFGVSGTYAVSWNFLKEGDGNIVLWKNPGGKVAKSQISQGRFVLLYMKKGETLRLKDFKTKLVRELTFCISLLHTHDIKAKESEIKILPKTDQFMKYNIQLSRSNDDLAQNIAEHFQQNHRNNSLVCQENIPRKCKESCKSSSEKQCSSG